MNGPAFLGAAAAVTSSRFVGIVAATEDSDPVNIFAQAGVFAVVLVVAYFLLKRSDVRERTLSNEYKAEAKVLRDENALKMAEIQHVTDRLIKALTELAEARAELAKRDR